MARSPAELTARERALCRTARSVRVKSADPPGTRFSHAALAGQHVPQLAAMEDQAAWQTWICARQSGKSYGCDGVLLGNALASPNSTNLLLGLKGTGVRTNNWEPIWLRLCSRFGIPGDWHNQTRMMTAFPNGARVLFAGTDDLENVRKFLGNRLDRSVVVIDESQDQKDAVLRYLLRTLLPPMLTPTSRVILAGVLPDVEAGEFLRLSNEPGWSHHEWGRAANVHTPEAMEQLAKYMADHGLAADDPQILRDWYMRRVWDPGATAYRYRREVAGYEGEPPDWLHSFALGIDPGAYDRTAIVVWGWGSQDHNVYHVHEWVTERNAKTNLSDIARECDEIEKRWRCHFKAMDMSLGKMMIDSFGQHYGTHLIKAANKADLPGQVARMADLIATGRAKIRIGSELEGDLQRARWDPDARAKGLWRWSSAWHPDVADAARYGLAGFFDSYEDPIDGARLDHLERIRRSERIVQRAKNITYDLTEFADDEMSDLPDADVPWRE